MKRKSINSIELCKKMQKLDIENITGKKRKNLKNNEISNKLQKLDISSNVQIPSITKLSLKSPKKMIDKECQTDTDNLDLKYKEMLKKELIKYKKLLDSKYELHLNEISCIKQFAPSDIY